MQIVSSWILRRPLSSHICWACANYATQASRRSLRARSLRSPVFRPARKVTRARNAGSEFPVQSQRRAYKSAEGSSSSESKLAEVSTALKEAAPADNSLLAPVFVPEDPNGVLNERHPATSILTNSAIVVQRQLELMNLMVGFEQANKYVIMDPQGNHIGFMAEQETGMGNVLARQAFRTHRSFTTHVFNREMKEVLRFHRPFAWISSRIRVYDPLEISTGNYAATKELTQSHSGSLIDGTGSLVPQLSSLPLQEMRLIGEAQQEWAPLRRKYNLFLHRNTSAVGSKLNNELLQQANSLPSNSLNIQTTDKEMSNPSFSQFAYVDEPFLSWDFSLLSADKHLIGSVNRNFAGFGREIFTDTGVYALRMDSAGLVQEPGHIVSQSGVENPLAYDGEMSGMTLDQRAVMLATAVTVDFDYFSRKSSHGGMGFMPLWFPGGGSGASEAENAGVAGNAGQAADDASPTSSQGTLDSGMESQEAESGQLGQEEEVWREPWEDGDTGNENQGEGGGFGDWLSDMLDEDD